MRCGLLWLLLLDSAVFGVLGSCRSQYCGNISIPYPFGVDKGCYLSEWFQVQCSESITGEFVLYIPKIRKEVVRIDLPQSYNPLQRSNNNTYDRPTYGSLRIKTTITSTGCFKSNDTKVFVDTLDLTDSPFTLGHTNQLIVVGCNNRGTLRNLDSILVGCISSCELRKERYYSRCDGYRCCQVDAPEAMGQVIYVGIEDSNLPIGGGGGGGCRVAFLSDEFYQSGFGTDDNLSDPQWFLDRQYALIQLRWAIPMTNLSFIESLGCVNNGFNPCACVNNTNDYDINGMRCACHKGYKGNPYVLDGCKDINECQLGVGYNGNYTCSERDTCVNTPGGYSCVTKKNKTLLIAIGFSVGFGVLILISVIFWLYKFIKTRKKINRKRKFFKRNGGLLLQQQLASTEGTIEKTIVFSSKQLEKATENFSLNRVLGQGGQGTVYKGMLVDGRIVAIKKSKVVDEDKLEEFINEVVILSQINHRNIVKLLGCCLETDVPLLVYEFIPNGNLFEHLHDESDDYTMATWEVRLRIAIEIAGALSYLHSSASTPIYHRDIKTTNIMLDEKYRAKVSDFGTSRSVTVDHTHLTTVVSGTAGYVDPQYFQSSQYTDKSDVYSFGVVLVELITGEKPLSFMRSQENRALATYFIHTMKDNRLFDIIDPRIKNDCKMEQVMAAAILSKRCLNLNGKKRPSMRQVSMELERIRSPNGDPQLHDPIVEDEEEEINIDVVDSCNNVSVTAQSFNIGTTSWLDAEPLFPRQTW